MNRDKRFGLALVVVTVAAFCRFLPHAPNFVPLTAMAIFGGAQLGSRKAAMLIVFGAMLLSDIVLGFHSTMLVVYPSLAVSVILGSLMREQISVPRLAVTSLVASLQFFVITNLGVFLLQSMYPKTLDGLVACYVMALPFFHATVISDLLYVMVFFGLNAFASRLLERNTQTAKVA